MQELFEIGDIVRVNPYKVTSMNGVKSEGCDSLAWGWVVGIFDKKWGGKDCTVFGLPKLSEQYWTRGHLLTHPEGVTLIEKGDGKPPIPGITYPFLPFHDLWIKIGHIKYQLDHTSFAFEGFTNSATYLAHLYIMNDRQALATCRLARRKCGTINPNNVRKAFKDSRLRVDDWALELPDCIPTDLLYMSSVWDKYRPRVNWQEVANNIEAA